MFTGNATPVLLSVILLVVTVASDRNKHSDEEESYHRSTYVESQKNAPAVELDGEYWKRMGQESLRRKLDANLNTNKAKNVIFFLGDGMSIPTITSARIYMGNNLNTTGENLQLAFDRFNHVGLSKTYCVNKQVPDSACTATAYLCGAKANYETIGVSANVERKNCSASLLPENQLNSILHWAQMEKKKTGIVTTTRITHASPAGAYAHTANRHWENDKEIIDDDEDPTMCTDIAVQLVHGPTGRNIDVILGGGYKNFYPKSKKDLNGKRGKRTDGRNLVEEWLENQNRSGTFIATRDELLSFNKSENNSKILGLFSRNHLSYYLEREDQEPTLEEMTEKAIKLLDNPNGFFLFVEGGRIDHAHHKNRAKKALEETLQLSKAVQKAVETTIEKDTLIVVTSDHAHVMSLAGYPDRGSDILGMAGKNENDVPYTSLSYANGPGYRKKLNTRKSSENTRDDNYKFPAMVELDVETHGGDDVAIFARGPWSHLFTGVNEQHVIPHLMAYASCVGEGLTMCDSIKEKS